MQPRPGLWQQTPPAIFPPVLGLLGLGMAWRRAGEVFSLPAGFGEIFLGAVALLYVFALLAYLGKFVRRPGALVDDLEIMPGQAGMSTASMGGMLLAAILVPYSTGLASGVMLVSLVVHLVLIALISRSLWRAPLPRRRMTGAWHLTYVGVIVAPLAGAPLGWFALSDVILVLSLAAALTIWAGSMVILWNNPVPPPLRPTLAIHLSPAVLFGIVSVLMGYNSLALVFGWLSIAGLALLVARLPYLTAAGFSPFWGAFTFPLAAFVNLMMLLAPVHGAPFRMLAGLSLVAASLAIPHIAHGILKMWAAGPLAVKTNAARA